MRILGFIATFSYVRIICDYATAHRYMSAPSAHSRYLSAVLPCLEAVAAIYRTVILRLKWNLGLLATLSAYYGEHLALFLLSTFTIATSLIAAITAANRLVLKALFCVKFLLACAEDEFLTAVLTY